jgi:hypothetical protein
MPEPDDDTVVTNSGQAVSKRFAAEISNPARKSTTRKDRSRWTGRT